MFISKIPFPPLSSIQTQAGAWPRQAVGVATGYISPIFLSSCIFLSPFTIFGSSKFKVEVMSNKSKYNVCLLSYTVHNPFLVIRFTFCRLYKCCLSCMRYLNIFKYSYSPPPSNWSWESFPLQFSDIKYFTLWLTCYGFSFLMSWTCTKHNPFTQIPLKSSLAKLLSVVFT